MPSNHPEIGLYELPGPWPEVVELRLSAFEALVWFGAEGAQAVPELSAVVRSAKDPRIRWSTAAQHCTGSGPLAKEAVPALIDLLRNPEKPSNYRPPNHPITTSTAIHRRRSE